MTSVRINSDFGISFRPNFLLQITICLRSNDVYGKQKNDLCCVIYRSFAALDCISVTPPRCCFEHKNHFFYFVCNSEFSAQFSCTQGRTAHTSIQSINLSAFFLCIPSVFEQLRTAQFGELKFDDDGAHGRRQTREEEKNGRG